MHLHFLVTFLDHRSTRKLVVKQEPYRLIQGHFWRYSFYSGVHEFTRTRRGFGHTDLCILMWNELDLLPCNYEIQQIRKALSNGPRPKIQ